jgi:hypothetical protein
MLYFLNGTSGKIIVKLKNPGLLNESQEKLNEKLLYPFIDFKDY